MSHSPNIQKALDALIDERDQHVEQARWLDERIAEFSRNGAEPVVEPEDAPIPSRTDTASRIFNHLRAYPGSTAGDISGALGLKRNSVSTKLTQMANKGEIKKERRGYSA